MGNYDPAGKSDPEERARQAIRVWSEEHSSLDADIESLVRAFVERDLHAATAAFEHMRALICDHLQREEDFAFPLIEQGLPTGAEPIRSLRLAHSSYRRELTDIRAQLDLGHLDAARSMYSAFVESFRTHERLEDQLLGVLGSR